MRMSEIVLDQIDPLRKAKRAEVRKSKRASVGSKEDLDSSGMEICSQVHAPEGNLVTVDPRVLHAHEVNSFRGDPNSHAHDVQANSRNSVNDRYISAEASHQVHLINEDEGCEFVDETIGQRCGSKFQLQRDHIKPHSLGGSSDLGNLRIYCASHNRWAWRNRGKSQVKSAQLAYV